MKMLHLLLAASFCSLPFVLNAEEESAPKQQKPAVTKEIKEITNTNNHNINIKANLGDEKVHKESKFFCSPKEDAPKVECEKWLASQKKALKSRLLTSNCSQAKFLYGKEEHGCMAYLSEGEVSFLLNQK